MTQIPTDDILESLYKLRIRESEKRKTVLELYNMEDKRAKSTQPNPSPGSSTQQNVRNASRARSPRGKSPSGKMARLPCKELAPLHSVKNGILQSACSTRQKMDVNLGISALTHTARLTISLARSLIRMVAEQQWLH